MSGTADLRGEDSVTSEEEETASQETGLCRPFGRREGLREVCLDRQCVSSTINIWTRTPICSIITRDAIIKLPSIFLFKIYQRLGMDISKFQQTDLLFLVQEILWQRVVTIDNCNLFENMCCSLIRLGGNLTFRELSFLLRNYKMKFLDVLMELYPRNYWHDVISAIRRDRCVF